ncbi:MAG: glutamate--tRNA ligase, partial [Promethearchaeota archaeon]
EIKNIISEIIKEINSLDYEKIEILYQKIIPEEQTAEISNKKGLPALPNVDKFKKVIMRLAPYPSGPLHIGNARMVILNDYYIKKYNGKLILAYDDTIGSAIKNIVPEAYDLIKDDLSYLGVEYDQVVYKSDRIKNFYDYCVKLIEKDQAYVCKCDAKEWREKNKKTKIPCEHRNVSIEDNLEEWEKMLGGTYDEGEAVLRFKSGMDLDDPALRDHILMRISNKIHPRVGDKYSVWPLLEFSWAIDDHLLGITHILRGKDLIKEDIIESMIWDIFGWRKAEFIHYGLISFKGLNLSKTDARLKIEKGIYNGWSDPRTWSIQSLKRRGILSKSIKELIINLRLSESDIKLSPKKLYSINRSNIDENANRYFFIATPEVITIKNVELIQLKAELYIHPDFPERGKRVIEIRPEGDILKILIENKDLRSFKNGEIIRLKDLVNIKILDKEKKIAEMISSGIDEFRELSDKMDKRLKIIHWLPTEDNLKIEVLNLDGSIISGYGENNCKGLKTNEIIQFERFGFCKVDRTDPNIFLYYSHS